MWNNSGGSILLLTQLIGTIIAAAAPLIAESYINDVNDTDASREPSHEFIMIAPRVNTVHITNESISNYNTYDPCRNGSIACLMTNTYQLSNSGRNSNHGNIPNITGEDALQLDKTTYQIPIFGIMLYRGTIFPYSIAAVVQLVISLFIFIVFLTTKSNGTTMYKYSHIEQEAPRCNTPLLILLVMFICVSTGINLTVSLLIFLYVHDILNWSINSAAYISTTYYIALASGRLVGVLITRLVSPKVYLPVCVTVTYVCVTLLFIIGKPSEIWVWAIIVAMGLAMALQYTGVFALGSNHIAMLPSTAAFLTFGKYIGGLVIPTMTGYYLEQLPLVLWLSGTLLLLIIVIIFELFVSDSNANCLDKLTECQDCTR